MMTVIFGKNVDNMWNMGQQTVSANCMIPSNIIGCLEADKMFDSLESHA